MSDYPSTLDTRPLTTWPGDLTPAAKRQRSQFSATLRNTLSTLDRELWHLGAKRPVLEVAIPADQFRLDGHPRAQAKAEHPGVVLSLPTTNVGALRYATDIFLTWQDNLRAIALGLEALRKVDRYGITRRGEQYAGFKALPPGAGAATGMTSEAAVHVVTRLAMVAHSLWVDSPDHRKSIVRSAKTYAHPDRNGGGRAAWDELETAIATLTRSGDL